MRSIRRLLVAALALVALGTAACDSSTAPTALTMAAPRADRLGGFTLVKSTSVQTPVTVSALLGSAGGTLSVNGHTLKVPAGALTQPTVITMSTVAGSSIQVSLSATHWRTGAPMTVFLTPLRLSLSYAGAQVNNPAKLKLAWVVNGQVVAVQPSDVDRSRKTVTSSVYHFSQWGIAY